MTFKHNFLSFLPILFVVIVTFIVLYPALFHILPDPSHEDLSIVKGEGHFGRNVSFLHPSPLYYFHQYGTQFTSLAIAYRFFDFNSKYYFILNVVLRILAVISIYYFVVKWSKNRITASIAALFFGINTAGIQSTTRVSLFQIYTAIIVFSFFLGKWFQFHQHPTRKTLIGSISFFLLTVLTHPVRLVGTVLLTFAGEFYWFFKNYKERGRRIRIYHFLTLIAVIFLLIFITGTLSSTPELSYKRVSPSILLLALFTGYPPVILSLWFFISNLIISPFSVNYGYISTTLIQNLPQIIPLFAILFSFNLFLKRKFLLVFLSIPVVIFSPLVGYSLKNLEGWQAVWIPITQFGGTFFLLSNLVLIKYWNRFKEISQIGLLGSGIVLANLLIPWLISPEVSGNDQSAFTYIHRYYTVPSIGMGMLIGSVLAICFYSIKDSLLQVKRNLFQLSSLFSYFTSIVFSFFLIVIGLWLIFIQAISTREFLIQEGHNINTSKYDSVWIMLEPTISQLLAKEEVTYIYLELDKDFDEKIANAVFKRRVPIHLGEINNPPQVNFIFNREDINNILNEEKEDLIATNSFFAFRIEGTKLIDIKDDVLESHTENK